VRATLGDGSAVVIRVPSRGMDPEPGAPVGLRLAPGAVQVLVD
jgi:hypothetical protein